ncbi:MAG: hypothetical protein KF716_11105 [Anaerolineae bacterium]|nr:hypothetical protein [Anaerolineae bacterium]
MSYSWLDKEFVGNLRDALVSKGQATWSDWESIPECPVW